MLDQSIVSKKVTDSIVVDERDVGKVTTIIVGYIPPKNQARSEPSPAINGKPMCLAPCSGRLIDTLPPPQGQTSRWHCRGDEEVALNRFSTDFKGDNQNAYF
jgi:hypothetical protein